MNIASDKVCALIYRLRQRDAKEPAHYEPDGEKGSVGSNEAEDEFREIPEDLPDDAVDEETRGQLEALNDLGFSCTE